MGEGGDGPIVHLRAQDDGPPAPVVRALQADGEGVAVGAHLRRVRWGGGGAQEVCFFLILVGVLLRVLNVSGIL